MKWVILETQIRHTQWIYQPNSLEQKMEWVLNAICSFVPDASNFNLHKNMYCNIYQEYILLIAWITLQRLKDS
jgi:hypothetical protein